MEAAALGLAGNAVGILLPKLQETFSSILKVRDNARFIKDELESMNAFLVMNAAMGQYTDDDLELNVWMSQVRGIAYDIEDWAEEFTWRLCQPHWHGIGSCFPDVVRFTKDLVARVKIANNVHGLKGRVLEVGERSKRYGLRGRTTQEPTSSSIIAPVARMQHDPRLGAHLTDDAMLVGMDGPRNTLMDWLIPGDGSILRIISVVGMGGLGKTTLVKKLYENRQVMEHFHRSAWITVSQTFSLKVLLRDMINQLLGSQVFSAEMTEGQLVQQLRDELMKLNTSYVIVLDDVWSLNAWLSFFPALPDNSLGSRIIVTTRNLDVASFCSQESGHVYHLKPLCPENSWLLFCKKAFPRHYSNCPPTFTHLSKEILGKCDGLPLAIVTIGGVLASKPLLESECQKLHDHLGTSIMSHQGLDAMTRILSFSYYDLPYYLKPLFLYLAIFPEDYQIRRKRLLRRWIAEGLVHATRDMSTEEVAEWYFKELMDRSMILSSIINGDTTVHSCHIHDIMLEFTLNMSEKDNLVSIITRKQQPPAPAPAPQTQDVREARHLALHQHSLPANIHKNKKLEHVRSLTVFSEGIVSLKNTSRMKLLRVLDLEGCHLSEVDGDLEVIGQFTLLRYLNLRNTSIRSLPKALAKLQNLETLDLRWTKVTEIPPHITKLHKLEYLSVGGFERDPSGASLTCHGAELPAEGMTALKALKTLSMVSFKTNPRELGEMTQLTKLGAKDITTPENAMAFVETLDKLSDQLRALKVSWNCDVPFLEEVSQPPVHLKSLWLSGIMITCKLPTWIASLDRVSKMALAHTELDEEGMQVLQRLPCLKELVLFENSYLNHELRFLAGYFPVLKLLQIDSLSHLTEFIFHGGGLQLEIIEILATAGTTYMFHGSHKPYPWPKETCTVITVVARLSTSPNPLQLRRYTQQLGGPAYVPMTGFPKFDKSVCIRLRHRTMGCSNFLLESNGDLSVGCDLPPECCDFPSSIELMVYDAM
ncbi:LOW QUALITY PROTEIN: disease resistance protein PIK6-NP-like [Dioscorea cayenensis subsp. rotundata]|uniref:LOW QUALITY PROTEIN: disease resistance protein PIK6-NP-like n=1 Tax=Dioscorea cayennensis subsp. rotundata TaxID=55577 RepID=A0AB40ATM3_DIOCR|nr:LOW QUALITY PROTEIN: disease resistance protein PIK6-NP-like [Dioscorea cayenensis subsp. rotundata]